MDDDLLMDVTTSGKRHDLGVELRRVRTTVAARIVAVFAPHMCLVISATHQDCFESALCTRFRPARIPVQTRIWTRRRPDIRAWRDHGMARIGDGDSCGARQTDRCGPVNWLHLKDGW